MSGFAITQRAFRFSVGLRNFAIDIQQNILFEGMPDGIGVSLYEQQPGGVWFNKAIEFGNPLMGASDAAITSAGGVSAFARQIEARVNQALNVIFGGASSAPPATLAEQVQQFLLANMKVRATPAGIPQVSLD